MPDNSGDAPSGLAEDRIAALEAGFAGLTELLEALRVTFSGLVVILLPSPARPLVALPRRAPSTTHRLAQSSEERLHSPVVIVIDEYSGLLRSDLEHILGALQPHRIRTAEVFETRISVDDVPVQIGLIKQEELVLGERVRADI
eukprot:jgi/Tetstr1/432413/TSEL_021809.t1